MGADDTKGRFLDPHNGNYVYGMRAARPRLACPSATTVLGEVGNFNSEVLTKWTTGKCLELALEHQPAEGEETDAWAKRIQGMHFKKNVMGAANMGTQIHEDLQNQVEGRPTSGKWDDHIAPVIEWIKEKGLKFLETEHTFVDPVHGFGGTIDGVATNDDGAKLIIDYKSRNSNPRYKMKPYEKELAQVGAYSCGFYGVDAVLNGEVQGVNVLISRNEPGKMEICGYPPEKVIEGWKLFEALLTVWRMVRKYDPRKN